MSCEGCSTSLSHLCLAALKRGLPVEPDGNVAYGQLAGLVGVVLGQVDPHKAELAADT